MHIRTKEIMADDDEDSSDKKIVTESNKGASKSVVVVKGCAQKASEYLATIPSYEDWKTLRQMYAKLSGEPAIRKEGMQIPHQVKIDPHGRGRGVFATKHVPKGKRIWMDVQGATFKQEEDLVKYLQLLASKNHRLQCDVLLWAYPYKGKAQVDLDVGSFINHADSANDINMDSYGFATRDIAPGEPILMNYTEFIEYGSVLWFDTIRNEAWKHEDQDSKVYQSTTAYNQLGAAAPTLMTMMTTSTELRSGTTSSSSLKAESNWEPSVGRTSHEIRLMTGWLLMMPLLIFGLFKFQTSLFHSSKNERSKR